MIDLKELKTLSAVRGPCLTVFVPLRDSYSQVTKAETRLVDAAQRADELLMENGLAVEDRARFLRPLFRLATNTNFAGRTGSLVIFRAPGVTRASFWPEILETRVTLGNEFFILPLLRSLKGRHSFWLLALSMKHVRLLHGTVDGLKAVKLPSSLPQSLMDAEGFATPELGLSGRSAPGGGNGQSGAVHFGTSSLHERQHAYLHDFFKMIERAIHPLLEASGEPMIIAAVPRELAIYREVNRYSGLLPEAIHGSPDMLTEPVLREKAAAILRASEPAFAGKALADMEAAAGRGLLENEANAILEASRSGMVERLYLATATRTDEEALNSAALAVLRNSGTVAFGDLPDGKTSAVILRYRAAGVTPALASV